MSENTKEQTVKILRDKLMRDLDAERNELATATRLINEHNEDPSENGLQFARSWVCNVVNSTTKIDVYREALDALNIECTSPATAADERLERLKYFALNAMYGASGGSSSSNPVSNAAGDPRRPSPLALAT